MEKYRPRWGLSIPVLTIVDENGRLVESDQRRLFRYLVQSGFGADILFSLGTTGEWHRIAQTERERLIALAVEEGRTINERLRQLGRPPIEVWVGVTGRTRAETLRNLALALELGADAGVIAPLSIEDIGEVVPFFHREVTPLYERKGRELPLLLYDNAEIAVHPTIPHIRTRDVKWLSRLPYICGIKVTAPPKVLGHYTKAALHFNERGEFGIYVGEAMLIFDVFRPTRGFLGKIREYWNLYLLHYALPIGVVAGPANVFPREWQKAWRVCSAGDEELMQRYRRGLGAFERLCTFEEKGRPVLKLVAAMKYALALEGVITRAHVAPGTPALTEEQKRIFAERYARLKEELRAQTDPLWHSRVEEGDRAPFPESAAFSPREAEAAR
ncbi:MAG: dihydrodipicolinate synthase family protein [Blastocatellia bacterium]|nr:dihydrodipicolinate synthase family protein [Blastocatellia bacterium]